MIRAVAIQTLFSSLIIGALAWGVRREDRGPEPAAACALVVQVRDEAQKPLAAATARIAGMAGAVVTGMDGVAQFSVGCGKVYDVRVKSQGFYPSKVDRVAVAQGEPVLVVTDLKRASVVSEIVVVTATGTATELQESPVRTEVIQAALADSQVKTNLAEAFQATVSGVRVEMNCQNCGFMQIRMNGLEGPYTQILEDGLPTYSGVTAVYGLEQIPASFLEQIEVVKGGNSALYGPGAVAGVINLIRREPRENRFRVDALGGWQKGRPEQQIGGSAQIVDMPGGLSGDFYVRSVNRVPVDRDGDGFSEMGKRRLDSGGFSLYKRLNEDRSKFSVNGTIANEFRRGGDQFTEPPERSWITEQVDSRRYSLAVNWNHTLTSNTYYSLRGSHAYYGRDSYYGSGMDPNAYGNTRNPVWVADAQAGHQLGKHSLLAGYQVWWEHVEDNAPAYHRTLGGTFNNNGVYLQDEWRATPRFTLLGGTRVDKSNRLERAILSPRAGVRAGLSNTWVARASVSTGFRAPAVFDEDLHIAQVGGEGFLLQNDNKLREERSLSFSGGLDYAGLLLSRRARLGVNLFRTNLHDAFTLAEDVVEGQGFRRLLRINGPDAEVGGASFDGSLRLSNRFGIRGGFTAQFARWVDPEPQFGTTSFFRTPSRYGFLGMDWSMPGGIEWSMTADFTGRMLAPHYTGYIDEDRLETTPRFLTFNTVVSRMFELSERRRMKLFFNMQNIGDRYQNDLDKGPNRDSAYVYGPSEMRRAVVGLSFEF